MNFTKIIKTPQRPEVYTPGTAMMWVDDYISTQLLATHLNQDIELASRSETTITSTVNWILEKVSGECLNILDLGCGPGLYAEKLAERGHRMTGMDFSSNSIQYAVESAEKKKLNIYYIRQDYLKLDENNRYDLIILIFTDFGVLTPGQRNTLLANIYRALKPGGTFIFDVLNENSKVSETLSKDWELSEKGFWRDHPYLAISESYYYEKENVTLNQHIILDESEDAEVYRFWIHTFSDNDLRKILSKAGFSSCMCYDSVLPDSGSTLPNSDMCNSRSVTFCVATK